MNILFRDSVRLYFPDLAHRVMTALVLGPLVLFSIWWGGLFFAASVLLVACIAFGEWVFMMVPMIGGSRVSPLLSLEAVWGFVSVLVLGSLALSGHYILATVCGFFFLSWVVFVCRNPMLGVGFVHVVAMVISLSVLRADAHYGFLSILFVTLIVWATDVGAFFSGRLLGGWKLVPRVSPNKTYAGFFGGIAFAMTMTFLFGYFFLKEASATLYPVALLMSIFGQAGDIFESFIKRSVQAKDSGSLLPGHGGILDRIDSLVFALVFAVCLGLMRGGVDRAGAGVIVW